MVSLHCSTTMLLCLYLSFPHCKVYIYTTICIKFPLAPSILCLISFVADDCADDSDEDVITDYLSEDPSSSSASGMAANKHGVPTISVTPHSPGSKVYPVLGNMKSFILKKNSFSNFSQDKKLYKHSVIYSSSS